MVLVDSHANPDAQWDNLAPDISVYAPDNVPDTDAKTNFSKMKLFVELKFLESPQAENFRFENDSVVP
jgi:hypothetical protein